MPEIDHRAEALRLAQLAEDYATEGTPARGDVLARVAQVHATLAASAPTSPPQDDPYWVQARELETLQQAVRELLDQSTQGPEIGTRTAPAPAFVRLRELVGEES